MPYPEFIAAKKIYQSYGLKCFDECAEVESTGYAAIKFHLDNRRIIFRLAKITPTKTGYFVTIWKRNADGITAPFDMEDEFDFFIIAVRKDNQAGQFIFPKAILLEQGVISKNKKSGKRGMRVYAPWDQAENKQAQKTQQWQLNYFFDYARDKAEYLYTLLK